MPAQAALQTVALVDPAMQALVDLRTATLAGQRTAAQEGLCIGVPVGQHMKALVALLTEVPAGAVTLGRVVLATQDQVEPGKACLLYTSPSP